MKVKIGNYSNPQLIPFLSINNRINQFFYNKSNRKIKVHIDKQDIWNADETLAHVILPILNKVKEAKAGSPFVDDEDVPEDIRSTSAPPKENEWDTDEFFEKRWKWVLDEMIWAFEEHIKEDPILEYGREEYDLWIKRKQKGFKLFGKYYQCLWT